MNSSDWKPNKWIAAVLGVFGQYFGMLYVGKGIWALFYFFLTSVIGILIFVNPRIGFFEKIQPDNLSNILGLLNLILMVIIGVHAYRIAAYSEFQNSLRPWYSKWYGLLGIMIIPILLIFSFRSFCYEPFRLPSKSMFPTIIKDSRLIAKKWGYGNYGTFGFSFIKRPISSEIERGNIIVFDFPKDTSVRYVKRVIGLPGDRVEFVSRKLKINDKLIETKEVSLDKATGIEKDDILRAMQENLTGMAYSIVYSENVTTKDFVGVVPADCFFVMGDNRDNSNDSRYWGFVPSQNVVGKVVYIIE